MKYVNSKNEGLWFFTLPIPCYRSYFQNYIIYYTLIHSSSSCNDSCIVFPQSKNKYKAIVIHSAVKLLLPDNHKEFLDRFPQSKKYTAIVIHSTVTLLIHGIHKYFWIVFLNQNKYTAIPILFHTATSKDIVDGFFSHSDFNSFHTAILINTGVGFMDRFHTAISWVDFHTQRLQYNVEGF